MNMSISKSSFDWKVTSQPSDAWSNTWHLEVEQEKKLNLHF